MDVKVHSWLQHLDKVYLLLKTVCKGKNVFFNDVFFPGVEITHTSEPYQRIGVKSESKSLFVTAKWYFGKI